MYPLNSRAVTKMRHVPGDLPQDQVLGLWCCGHQRILNGITVGTGETLEDVFISLLSSEVVSEEKG